MEAAEIKTLLEGYAATRAGIRNRVQHIADLKRAEQESQTPGVSWAAEYTRQIAAELKADQAIIAGIDAAVAALSDPLSREVIRLRYMELPNAQLRGWKEISAMLYGADYSMRGGKLAVMRRARKAFAELAQIMK